VHRPNTARRHWLSVTLASIGWLGSVFVAFSVPGTFAFVVVSVVLPGYLATAAFGVSRAARSGTLIALLIILATGSVALLLVKVRVPERVSFRLYRSSMERDVRNSIGDQGPMPTRIGPYPVRRAIRHQGGVIFEVAGTRAWSFPGGADGYAWGPAFADDDVFKFRHLSGHWWRWHENFYGDSHTFDTVATGFSD
jgi:hypothetical protein